MPASRSRVPQLLFAAIACVAVVVTIAAWVRIRADMLGPRRVHVLSPGNIRDWRVYGGTWESVDDGFHNGSDERGAKLVSGSPQWTDYTLQADLHFDGDHGDMGVMVRSNAEQEGVDAYRGYYAGLRTTDGTLVIGRAEYGWLEAKPVPMPGGVDAHTWYRIAVTAYRCSIAAESENLSTHSIARVVLEENPCIRSGRIGLRSLATGGRWRNISVSPAGLQDFLQIRQHVDAPREPEFPKREADYNRILPALPLVRLVNPILPPHLVSAESPAAEPSSNPTSGDALRIGDLLNLPRDSMKKVILRGVVTLATPGLYIQDSTGGVLVNGVTIPLLNVGDVVEVRGRARGGLFGAVLQTDSIRELWTGTPMPPISVTPSQAASGVYDARYIEVEGRLTGDELAGRGVRILDLTDGVQSFRVFATAHKNEQQIRIATNSLVRVRGVCVLDRQYTRDLTPFAVLLRSGNDMQVLANPPWWTPWHAVLLFAGILVTALFFQVAYFRIKRWKTATITHERERLAHEIHDTMAQGFAGIGYQIQGIRKIVHQNSRPDLNHISDQLTLAYQLVRRCHEEASRTITVLSASTPDIQENLLATLADAAHRIAGEQIRTTARVEGTPLPLSLRVANGLMHIGREAIANAAGHAEPNLLELVLRFEDACVELIVRDDGRGFNYSPAKAGFGISGMQKRARELGSTLEIISSPGMGTEVRVRVALHSQSLARKVMESVGSLFTP